MIIVVVAGFLARLMQYILSLYADGECRDLDTDVFVE